MDVLINYPNAHFTIHRDSGCGHIRSHNKVNQRNVTINPENLLEELNKFGNKEYTFAATHENNDMWLRVQLSSPEHEEALVYIIQELIGRHYSPLKHAEVRKCGCG